MISISVISIVVVSSSGIIISISISIECLAKQRITKALGKGASRPITPRLVSYIDELSHN